MGLSPRIPPIRLPLIGYLLESLGFHWDIAWHVVIGRDSFWSAPHLVAYSSIALVLMSGAVPI